MIDLPPETDLAVAGNGHVLTVGQVLEVIAPLEAMSDECRLIEYLVEELHAANTRSAALQTKCTDLRKAGQKLTIWTSERVSKIGFARYLETEGQKGKLAPELDELIGAKFDGWLASFREEFADE